MHPTLADSVTRYRGIVFDFDGTLFNLNVDWARLKRTLAFRFPGFTFDRLGHGLLELEESKGPVLLREAFDIIHQFEIAQPAEPIESALDVACACALRGQRIAIFSANTEATIRQTLRREGLPDLFDIVIGGDSVRRRKPHPEGLVRATVAMGLRTHEVLYVADGVAEVDTGKRAEMQTYRVA